MMDTSLTRPRAHQRVGEACGAWYERQMYLENLCIDAQDPAALGRFWEALLERHRHSTTSPTLFETRLHRARRAGARPVLPAVPEPRLPDPRLHLDLAGGAPPGARWCSAPSTSAPTHLDIGQGDVPWVVLADPEGNPFCVMEERPEYATSGPIAALPLDSADPARDAAFWAELSGWKPVSSVMPAALRHPSGRGVLLELCPEQAPSADRPEEPAAPRHPPRGG